MTLKRDINLFGLLSLIILLATPAAVPAVDLGLTGLLTSQLSVTEPQAMGGAGAIFSYAKEKLSPESFTKVANAVPEMDQLLGAAPAVAAPKPAGSAPGLGALAGQGAATLPGGDAIGGVADKATGLQSLSDSFGKLGMEPDMVGKFTSVLLDYVKSKGGDAVGSLLAGALP
ncbi:MAG: DUF2780 domain-containing protein [Chromatiales bacterium]